MSTFQRATFGNKEGSHQLISSTLPVGNSALDQLRFLVDRPAGHIDLSIPWSPYWGWQRIDGWWALWRGEEDPSAPRRNMVRVEVALLPIASCAHFDDITALLAAVGDADIDSAQEEARPLAATVVQRLASTEIPVVISGIWRAPSLLCALWPRLWTGARAALSLRTVFGPESLNTSSPLKLVVFPAELSPRWRGYPVVNEPEDVVGPASRWFAGNESPQFERLLRANFEKLPGDFSILERIERLVERLERLHLKRGTLSDALVVVRTQEGFPSGLTLPDRDLAIVSEVLLLLADGSIEDIRTASLTTLDNVTDRGAIEGSLATWVEKHMPDVDDQDALWLLQHHLSLERAAWWKRGVKRGLTAAFKRRQSEWAGAFWRWCVRQPTALDWLAAYLNGTIALEGWLASNAPRLGDGFLLQKLKQLCKTNGWATLLATALGDSQPLVENIAVMRAVLGSPEDGIHALLSGRTEAEIVDAAVITLWSPVIVKAAEITRVHPSHFGEVVSSPGLIPLLLAHLRGGGNFPGELLRQDFLTTIFDGLLRGDQEATEIASHLNASAGSFVIVHPLADQLLGRLDSEIVVGAAEGWWSRFLANNGVEPPPSALNAVILTSARRNLKDNPITLLLGLIEVFSDINEITFIDWMQHTPFRWSPDDYQRVADFLLERRWERAAHIFRWSWKRELILVAWYARALLSWSDAFWTRPEGASERVPLDFPSTERNPMIIDIGIITIKEEEYEALLDKFNTTKQLDGKNRDYDLASVPTDRGVCHVAITRCLQQGNANAQNAVNELLHDLEPRFVLVVGIAGGVPSQEFCLGDVVISNYIQDLTLEDTGSRPGMQRFNALGGPLHPAASRIVERLRAIERGTVAWNTPASIAQERPIMEGELTTTYSDWNESIHTALARHSMRDIPLATAQKVASSDRLVKDPELLNAWRHVLKAVAAVEMESAGAYVPCQRNNVPILAIRGISDIIGLKRDEAWTLYACHTAAAYVRMLVRSGVFCLRDSD